MDTNNSIAKTQIYNVIILDKSLVKHMVLNLLIKIILIQDSKVIPIIPG